MPKIRYVAKRFSTESLALIERANAIIADYQQQDLVLTLRQLFYRFVAADVIPNTEKSYKRLGSIVNDARLAGLLDWAAIEDRGRNLNQPSQWDNPGAIIRAASDSYALDKWVGQRHRVECWVEKQALEAVIGQACEPLNCPYYACKGYVSQSEMWRAALRLTRYAKRGQKPVIIHLGDHDPSGIDMTRDIQERLHIFGVTLELRRIALNMDQVEQYRPPPNPAKITDSRCAGYIERFGDESWELDALEPATLRDLIKTEINRWLDRPLFDAIAAREAEERELLIRAADRWNELVEMLDGEDS
jgi:hypothetical protein